MTTENGFMSLHPAWRYCRLLPSGRMNLCNTPHDDDGYARRTHHSKLYLESMSSSSNASYRCSGSIWNCVGFFCVVKNRHAFL
jgi:hypothetical protein